MSWRDQAACKGHPTDWWYPEQGESSSRARQICATCPVRRACGDYATSNETNGVWAGVQLDPRRVARSRDRIRVKDRVLAELQAERHGWVNSGKLADHTGIHHDSIRRSLRELVADGVLEHQRGGYYRLQQQVTV